MLNRGPTIACPKCRAHFGPGFLNLGQLAPCPSCQTPVWAEVYAALFRPVVTGANSEAILVQGESACFYHESKKAAVVCDGCGRFLCALCDCVVGGQHFCPPCLETGDSKRQIETLEKSRALHGRQALILAILPLFLTGLAALFVVIRYWKAPGSLVKPQRWLLPAALVLASLQTIAYLIWIAIAIYK